MFERKERCMNFPSIELGPMASYFDLADTTGQDALRGRWLYGVNVGVSHRAQKWSQYYYSEARANLFGLFSSVQSSKNHLIPEAEGFYLDPDHKPFEIAPQIYGINIEGIAGVRSAHFHAGLGFGILGGLLTGKNKTLFTNVPNGTPMTKTYDIHPLITGGVTLLGGDLSIDGTASTSAYGSTWLKNKDPSFRVPSSLSLFTLTGTYNF